MKRITILLALLVLVAAGCASQGGASAEATVESTPSPTPEATDSPSPEATASEGSGDSGGGGDLTALLPDEVGGLSRTDIPGMEAMIGSALASTGVNAEGAEYAFASYGDGTQALIVTALRIPGLPEASLQMLATAMAGTNTTGANVEPTTVGDKEVLRLTSEGAPDAAYLYFAEGAVFTIVGEDPQLAAQLLAELP